MGAHTHTHTHTPGLHPTQRGASALARNLGRHVRGLFWKIPKKTRRPPPHLPEFYSMPQLPRFAGDPIMRSWQNRYSVLGDWF